MRGSPLRITDFSAGLVLNADETDLPPGASSSLADVEPMPNGGLKSRPLMGLGFAAATPGAAVRIFRSLASHRDYGQVGTNIVNLNDSTVVTTIPTAAGATRAIFIDAPASGGQGPTYLTDGSDFRYITASGVGGTWTASAGSFPSSPVGMCYAGNRVWMASGATATGGSRVQFSALGDPRDWPATNYVDIDPWNHGKVTALQPLGPYVVVFKEGAIYVIYDLNTGANRLLARGLTAGHADTYPLYGHTAVSGRGIYFVDSVRGVCLTDGSSVVPLGDPINGPATNSIYGVAATNRYLFVATASYLYVFDHNLSSWWRHTVAARAVMPTSSDDSSGEGVYFVTSGGKYSYLFPAHNSNVLVTANTDDIGAFAPTWESASIDFQSPLRKRLRTVELAGIARGAAGAVALDLSVAKNLGSYGTARSVDFGVSSGNGVAAASNFGVAYHFKIKLATNAGRGSYGFKLRSLTMWMGGRTA